MYALHTIERIVLILLGLVVLTQVAWPLAMGRKLFPMFRREGKLKAELADREQEAYNERLVRDLKRTWKHKH